MILRIVLLCLFTCVLAKDDKLNSPAKRFLASLPKSDKNDFLILALARGYSAEDSKNHNKTVRNLIPKSVTNYPDSVKKSEVPENFENNFYLYTKDTFDLSRRDIKSLIQSRKICFSRRKCINIDDIGNMCCPF